MGLVGGLVGEVCKRRQVCLACQLALCEAHGESGESVADGGEVVDVRWRRVGNGFADACDGGGGVSPCGKPIVGDEDGLVSWERSLRNMLFAFDGGGTYRCLLLRRGGLYSIRRERPPPSGLSSEAGT